MTKNKKIWRHTCKDKSFVEGVRHSGEHVHYDSSGGSDIPVHWRDEKTGDGISLRREPIKNISSKGEEEMAKKKNIGRSMADVRKGTQDGDRDIRKKSDTSEGRVSDLEKLIEKMGGVRGGVNQDSVEAMKKEIQSAVDEQRRQFEKAAGDVHNKEKDLEERIDILDEGASDKDEDAKDAHSLLKSLKTDFVKQHLSKLEQESKSESGDYKEQKKGLESTMKEVGRQMKDQERRAKKSVSFTKI